MARNKGLKGLERTEPWLGPARYPLHEFNDSTRLIRFVQFVTEYLNTLKTTNFEFVDGLMDVVTLLPFTFARMIPIVRCLASADDGVQYQ